MDAEKDMKQEEKQEQVTVRHTINAEETFTLAKDVFDIRCFIKNVYNNRAVIARRLNVLTLSISFLFTALYIAYIFATGLMSKLSLPAEVFLYVLLGAYGALFIAMLIITLAGGRKAKNVKKIKKTLSVFRLIVRLLSLAIAIAALVFAAREGGVSATQTALNIVLIIFSIVTLVFTVIPLFCGGLGKMARWLLSPVKRKVRFSAVALEWYELTVTGGGTGLSVKKVSHEYYDAIGKCLDNFLIPQLGKKWVSSVKSALVLSVTDKAEDGDREIVEGILKSVFAYAEECGYVTFNPCKDLELSESIYVSEKPPKKTMKDRLVGMGKKIGKSMLDKYIISSSEDDKK